MVTSPIWTLTLVLDGTPNPGPLRRGFEVRVVVLAERGALGSTSPPPVSTVGPSSATRASPNGSAASRCKRERPVRLEGAAGRDLLRCYERLVTG